MLDVKRALKAAQVPARTHTLPLSTSWGEAIAAAGDDALPSLQPLCGG